MPPPIEYRSPDTPAQAKLPVGIWDEAFGCLPAIVACAASVSGTALYVAVTVNSGSDELILMGLSIVGLFVGGRCAIAALRSPRGFWPGIAATLCVLGATVAFAAVTAIYRNAKP